MPLYAGLKDIKISIASGFHTSFSQPTSKEARIWLKNIFCPFRDSKHDLLVVQSLYQLSYPYSRYIYDTI
jgi:hypothetical protein